jgi:hypothetical protein
MFFIKQVRAKVVSSDLAIASVGRGTRVL